MKFNKCAEKVDSEKKLKIVQDQEIQSLSLRLIDCLSFDFESSFIDLCYDISLAKLMKESNTIVNQVDWSTKRCKKDLYIKCRKHDDENNEETKKMMNIDIERRNVNSDDKTENELKKIDKISFVKNDERNDYKSESYENDERDEYESELFENDEKDQYESEFNENDEKDEYESEFYEDDEKDDSYENIENDFLIY